MIDLQQTQRRQSSSGYPVIDKAWVDGLSPYKVHFKGDPELLAVCEPAENPREDVEGGNKLGGRICEGRWKEVDEGSKEACIYWSDNATPMGTR